MPADKSKPNTPQIDTHFHVFFAGKAVPGARYVPGYDASRSAWQAAAAPCGVTRGVLVQTSFMGTDNRLLLAQLAAQPDHLRGVAVVSPDATRATLQPMHDLGVRGIRLNLAGASHDMTAWASATLLWDAMLARGWHLELHTDGGALPAVLACLPEALPVVVDHFGKPQQATLHDATFSALIRRSRKATTTHGVPLVHVKLSAAYRLGGLNPATLAHLWLNELGPAALVWGSDWPCTNHEAFASYSSLHGALHDWLGDQPQALHAILSDNPARLYWPSVRTPVNP